MEYSEKATKTQTVDTHMLNKSPENYAELKKIPQRWHTV